jgi:16S rRNA processing protein RimM
MASKDAARGDRVVMGQVLLPYGVQGWIRVRPYTEEPETLLSFTGWWLRRPGGAQAAETPWVERTLRGGRRHGESLLALLDGVESREAAMQLKGSEIAVLRALLPEVTGNVIYQADLVGLEAINLQGVVLGRVVEVTDFGAHPLLRVCAHGEGTRSGRWIPYVAAHVVRVDVAAGRIEVDWGEDF